MLADTLESWALPYLAPALQGDVAAAESLVFAAGNRNRGVLAHASWKLRTAVPAYQMLLSSAWNHDHQHVIAAARNRRTLRAMFRYAAFPLPEFPDVVRAWRGTSHVTQWQAMRGYSWTLERDVACWFALRCGEQCRPLVLAVDVPKAAIAHFGDDRNEKEVVIFDASNSWVDGVLPDWKLGHERYSAEIERRTLSWASSRGAGQ